MRRALVLLVVFSALLSVAVASQGKIIYGTDDRKDTYQVSNTLQNLGEGVAVFMSGSLQLVNGNYVPTSVGTAQTEKSFCANERFSDQEVIPTTFCTGFLLSKNPPLMATAAHCVSDGTSDTTIVFRYELFDSDGTNLVYDDSDVYTISEVISVGLPDAGANDYALVRLDRAVTGRDAYDSATSDVKVGDSTIMIGHPVGIPKKFDSGGAITAVGSVLRATVDAYGGNSGSPIFNNDRELIGILVAGGTDFDTSSGCRSSNFCPGGIACDALGEVIVPICTLLNRAEVQAVLDFNCDDNNSDSNNSNSNNSNSNNSNSGSNSNNSNSNNSNSDDSSSSSSLMVVLAVVFCAAFLLF